LIELFPNTVRCARVAQPFLLTAHPALSVDREGTPQNFALRNGVTKPYVATKTADPVCYIDSN